MAENGSESSDTEHERDAGDPPGSDSLDSLLDGIGSGGRSEEPADADGIDALVDRSDDAGGGDSNSLDALVDRISGRSTPDERDEPAEPADAAEPIDAAESADAGRSSLDGADEIEAALADASDVLVLGPLQRSVDHEVCASLLGDDSAGPCHAVLVSLSRSVEDRVSHLRDAAASPPGRISVVATDDGYRSARDRSPDAGGSPLSIETVDDPSDLTRLGITISTALSAAADGEEPIRVCFHSLTGLLQYTSLERAFRFLHVLQGQLDGVGAVTHYHMDPAAHDKQTVATIRSLFDAVLEVTDDGIEMYT